MAAEDLPSEFDVVILGTGLAESVVAAACSRVGQRVLHLDRRSYYAANWASFTFNALLTWIQEQQEGPQPEQGKDWSSLLNDGEELIHLSNPDLDSITNIQVVSYASEEDEEVPDTAKEETSANSQLEVESAGSREEKSAEEESAEAEEESAEAEEESAEAEEESAEAEEESAEAEEESAEAEEESAEAEVKEQGTNTKGEETEVDQSHPGASSGPSEPTRKKISYAQLVKEGRRFNIDLVSKLLFSRGSLVDLLIRSNVSRYTEFKNVTRILTYRHGNLQQVPCSRADVFASRQLSVVEKRKLMRFLTSCIEETEMDHAYSSQPYSKYLQDQQLGENLQHFLLHSIAMVTEDTPTEAGLASTRHFLRSLGRYGNSPFLFPVYGLGEIPQCFCRMSAVFGGIYCLRHSVSCLIVDRDANRCKAVIDSRGQRISCSHFVVEDGYLGSRSSVTTPTRLLSRAILITDSSVLPGDSEQQVSMVTIPPGEVCQSAVKMVELCSSTMTCMPGTYLVHLTCQSVGSAFEDLSQLVTKMFQTPESQEPGGRPTVLWSLYFNMADGSVPGVEGQGLPSNVHVCSGPEGSLDHEHSIKQAELIFQRILPEEEFCPPAPNPEDIIYDGESPTPSAEEDSGKEAGQQEESGGDLNPQLDE